MQREPEYTVIKDTREKQGWFFKRFGKCKGTVVQTLKTGDYTIEGLEDILCVERKASPAEIAINMGKKKNAFDAEMERISKFRLPYLVLEFSVSELLDFPENSGIPQHKIKKVKMSGKYLLRCILEYQIKYGINVLFCGDKTNAWYVTSSIFKRANELSYQGVI